nr:beta-glucosidase [Raoultella sp. NCTC 9187]
MSTKRIAIPDDFILGAAASAWQTEGWSGKKRGPGLLARSLVQTRSPRLA